MTTLADMRAFSGLCDGFGLQTPAPIVKGLELSDAAAAFMVPPTRTLLQLETADLPAVLSDLALREHTAEYSGMNGGAKGVRSGLGGFDDQLLREVHDATVPLLDDLIRQLQDLFDVVAESIVQAVRQIGFTSRTEAPDVLATRNWESIQVAYAAQDAHVEIQRYVTFRTAVSTMFNVAPANNPGDYSVCFAAGDNWSTDGRFNEKQQARGIVDIIAIAAGGLHLNTIADVETKLGLRHAATFASTPHEGADNLFAGEDPDELTPPPTFLPNPLKRGF